MSVTITSDKQRLQRAPATKTTKRRASRRGLGLFLFLSVASEIDGRVGPESIVAGGNQRRPTKMFPGRGTQAPQKPILHRYKDCFRVLKELAEENRRVKQMYADPGRKHDAVKGIVKNL